MAGRGMADALTARIQGLQDNLQQSQIVADDAEAILVDLEDQLAELQQATVHIYTRTQALTWARHNINLVQTYAENMLEHLDMSRKVEKKIRAGPGHDLDCYLGYVQQLNKAIDFLQNHEAMRSTSAALKHTRALHAVALEYCLETFRQTLSENSIRPDFNEMASQALAQMKDVRGKAGARPKGRRTADCYTVEVPTVVAPHAVSKLSKLAEVVLPTPDHGEGNEVLKVYVESRRRMLELALEPSGLKEVEELAVKMPWEVLEKRIQSWIILAHVLTRMLMAERNLARSVFRAPNDDVTFSKVVATNLESLLQYGHAIAMIKRTPEKVFALLDMQEHLSVLQVILRLLLMQTSSCDSLSSQAAAALVLWNFDPTDPRPNIAGPVWCIHIRSSYHCSGWTETSQVLRVLELCFDQACLCHEQGVMKKVLKGATCAPLLSRVQALLKRLAKTAHNTFGEFEDTVSQDSTRHSVQDGTVHPLTAYVITYVKRLFSYRSTLFTLFWDMHVSSQLEESGASGEESLQSGLSEEDMGSRIASMIINILVALIQNLEDKARVYKTLALQSLFLMNNLNYVVRSMQSYGSSQLLPEEWVSRHRALVNMYKTNYLMASWEPVFAALRAELMVPTNKLQRKAVKQQFKFINQEIKSLDNLHTTWVIPDSDLREEVRQLILVELLPLYNKFYAHYRDIYFTKRQDKYLVYTDADLRNMVKDFFSKG